MSNAYMTQIARLEELLAEFRRHGGTDEDYLTHHYARFAETRREFCSTWDRTRGARVLDIGAHWLHQSLLWSSDGYEVTAVDLPTTFDLQEVRNIARVHRIRLVPCADLAGADALEAIESDSIDILLFTEIIEHITFNPVRLWKQVHRILTPGARIVITTPNYYAFGSRAWQLRRFVRGNGGGIRVEDILGTPTYGHHWREFSRSELIRYFELLSPDFVTFKCHFAAPYELLPSHPIRRLLYRQLPWFRPNIHLEIELKDKSHGVAFARAEVKKRSGRGAPP